MAVLRRIYSPVGRGMSLLAYAILAGILIVPSAVFAETESSDAITLIIKNSTLRKGITVKTTDRRLIVGVPPSVTATSALVHVVQEPAPPPSPEKKSFASSVWHFTVTDNAHDATQTTPSVLAPFSIVIRPNDTSPFAKRIAVWDAQKQRWIQFTTSRQHNGALRASVKKHDFLVTVLQENNVVLGKGSWFRSRHTDAAASNDFPMGTKLRITNLENKKRTTVTVRSTGPFVQGRVVDISRQAFKQLAPLGSGILHALRVERLQ